MPLWLQGTSNLLPAPESPVVIKDVTDEVAEVLSLRCCGSNNMLHAQTLMTHRLIWPQLHILHKAPSHSEAHKNRAELRQHVSTALYNLPTILAT